MAKWLFEIFGPYQFTPDVPLSCNDKACMECTDVGNIESVIFASTDGYWVNMSVIADGITIGVNCKMAWATLAGGLNFYPSESNKKLIQTIPDIVDIDLLNDGQDMSTISYRYIHSILGGQKIEYFITDPRIQMLGYYCAMPREWVDSHISDIPTMDRARLFIGKYGLRRHFNFYGNENPHGINHLSAGQIVAEPYYIIDEIRKGFLAKEEHING